jgi:hypothetical protein
MILTLWAHKGMVVDNHRSLSLSGAAYIHEVEREMSMCSVCAFFLNPYTSESVFGNCAQLCVRPMVLAPAAPRIMTWPDK